MVNKAEVQQLIDAINWPSSQFEMSLWRNHTECGTAYCLGGWVAHLNGIGDNRIEGEVPFDVMEYAAEALGLEDEDIAWRLFIMGRPGYRRDGRNAFDDLRAEQRKAIATRVLEELRDTGGFEWRKHWEAVAPGTVPEYLTV